MAWHDAGPVQDLERTLAPGSGRRIEAGGPVALFRTETGWAAFEDRCPHMGAPLSLGAVREGVLVCSWHGWRFDAASGDCGHYAGAPGAVVRPVRVEGGRVLVGDRGEAGLDA